MSTPSAHELYAKIRLLAGADFRVADFRVVEDRTIRIVQAMCVVFADALRDVANDAGALDPREVENLYGDGAVT